MRHRKGNTVVIIVVVVVTAVAVVATCSAVLTSPNSAKFHQETLSFLLLFLSLPPLKPAHYSLWSDLMYSAEPHEDTSPRQDGTHLGGNISHGGGTSLVVFSFHD